jgi:hypothetical protein
MKKSVALLEAKELANKYNTPIFIEWTSYAGYVLHDNLKQASRLEWPLIIFPDKVA